VRVDFLWRADCDAGAPEHSRGGQPLVDEPWPAKKETLTERDTQALNGRLLGIGFETLREDMRPRDLGKVDKPDNQGLAGNVRVSPTDQAGIDLHQIGPKLNQMPEIGDAGTRIIDRQAYIATKPAHG
jgi:hypothetical protein